MFKRANKITALLVAAASVMSVVPAMADDASTSRLGSKDGTIENAVAFQDGKYIYQGYKSDDDDDAIYYNGGDQDKALDDLEDADLNGAYADKYAFANDGSDQYVVDMTSGEVSDDITPEDDADSAATKLQTKLKKTDRYGEQIEGLTAAGIFANYSDGDSETGALPGNKFGDVWYSYAIGTDVAKDTDAGSNLVTTAGGVGYLYGFTNQNGTYVDASNLANIYAYSTKEGKMVKVENYSNDFGDVDDDTGLLATLYSQPVVLTQDKDYLYTLVTVAVTDTATNAVATIADTSRIIDTKDVIKSVDAGKDTDTMNASTTVLRTYVQKVSKAQGDQKDDAYLPKTVESYEVGNYDGDEFDCGDAKDAYNAFTTLLGNDLTKVVQSDVVDSDTGKAKFSAVNGNLIGVDTSDDSVDGISFTFKKDKVKFEKTFPGYKDADDKNPTSSANTWDDNDKVDAYLLEKDTDDSVDVDTDSDASIYKAYDFDVDGNLWVVADGKVYEYTNGEMSKKFNVDSSLDSISVYDENSLITWEDDGDIYTTVNEGKAETASEAPATTTAAAQTGWVQLADGTWNFYDATGTKLVNNWANVGGVWYYLGADGVMATGWAQVGGTWYYLNASGAMQTGWVNDNGTWYYLQSSGAMATGWVSDNGTWYYLNASGAMLANTTVDGYVLGASGAWIQ